MDRRQFLQTSGIAAGCFLVDSGCIGAERLRASGKRPNILMITSHDLGQHLGCYGIREVESDNIDKLAAKGVRFANMFSTSAVCSPAHGQVSAKQRPDGPDTFSVVVAL